MKVLFIIWVILNRTKKKKVFCITISIIFLKYEESLNKDIKLFYTLMKEIGQQYEALYLSLI